MNFRGRGGGFHRLGFDAAVGLPVGLRGSRRHQARIATGSVTGSGLPGPIWSPAHLVECRVMARKHRRGWQSTPAILADEPHRPRHRQPPQKLRQWPLFGEAGYLLVASGSQAAGHDGYRARGANCLGRPGRRSRRQSRYRGRMDDDPRCTCGRPDAACTRSNGHAASLPPAGARRTGSISYCCHAAFAIGS